MSISILLVDDHALFRKGLRAMLEEDDLNVVGEAGDGLEAYDKVKELQPDVVVMDITMPNSDGIEASGKILADFPDTKIIALSIHGGKRFVENMLQTGAVGYILKDSAPEELETAIRTVHQGGQYLSSEVTGLVVSQYMELLSRTQTSASKAKLTKLEKEYILLIGEGCDADEIASRHELDADALADLEEQIIKKLGMSSKEEFIEYVGAQKWFSGHDGVEQSLKKSLKERSKQHETKQDELIEPLTNRELDTLELLMKRLYNKEIADELSVSVETVKTHVKNIFQKLDVGNRREAMLKAEELGLVSKD
ncbi:response regulator [Pontiella sulfatireligans]|uniref:Oxygen regulatory protein NreC n=1 Tax=Pontiella sulfatireligans TaxID=2750658 RepID=A0A6C2USZ6_9BACT|nr:response regulator [Pontiella sulfatireligans]VGO23460.1 Oxygen regulatory protein NreC [Pontiella sulfatireligans]